MSSSAIAALLALGTVVVEVQSQVRVSQSFDLSASGCKENDIDYLGNDIVGGDAPGYTEQGCMDWCKADAACVMAMWAPVLSDRCFKKHSYPATVPLVGVKAFFPTCTDVMTVDEAACMHVGLVHEGNDITTTSVPNNAEDCRQECMSTAGCLVAAWYSAPPLGVDSCHLKSALNDIPLLETGVDSVYPDCTTDWSAWSQCSSNCGYGTRSRISTADVTTQMEYCEGLPACQDRAPTPAMRSQKITTAAASDFATNLATTNIPIPDMNGILSDSTFCSLECLAARGADPTDHAACNAFAVVSNQYVLGVVADLDWMETAKDDSGTDIIYLDIP